MRARACLLLVCAAPLSAQTSSVTRLAYGAFVDGYYAYDLARPVTDRPLTTQAARHNQPDLNLAFVDARLTAARVRGRLALQSGTSVRLNYATEPRIGPRGDADLAHLIQEAFGGYRVVQSLWLDGGVMLAPFGAESWISSENWTYTRSLVADYSPYYEAGVRASWQSSPRLSAQMHLMNGWQVISETNRDKAVGIRVDYAATPALSVAYDAFVGNERSRGQPRALRLFQEVMGRARLSDRIEGSLVADYGRESSDVRSSYWRGAAAILRYRAIQRAWLAGRIESYSDPQGVIITGTANGTRLTGASLTVDVPARTRWLWRSEIRALHSAHPVFPDATSPNGVGDHNVVLVTSVSWRAAH